MRLSEAIRIGSKMHRPTKRGWFNRNNQGEMETCALIAGAFGAGCVRESEGNSLEPTSHAILGERYDSRIGEMVQTFPLPEEWIPVCASIERFPCGCKDVDNVMGCVQHLHDTHQWSREATAEWIEVIEKKLEPHPPCAEVDLVRLGDAAGDAASISAAVDPVHVS